MNTSQKKPLLYIGLIAFLAISVIGIIYDLISESKGIVAVISVSAAFLILAAVLVIDGINRKRESKQSDEPALFPDSDDVDRRFLRHTEQNSDDDFSWQQNAAPRTVFERRRSAADDTFADDPFAAVNAPVESDTRFDDLLSDPVFETELPEMNGANGFAEDSAFDPDPFAASHVAASENFTAFDDAQQAAPEHPETVQSAPQTPYIDESALTVAEAPAYPEEPAYAETPASPEESAYAESPIVSDEPAASEPQSDDIFKPVLKLTGTQPEAPVKAPEEPSAAPTAAQDKPIQQVTAAPAAEPPAAAPAPQEPAEKPRAATAAERRAAAAVPAAAVVSTAVGGQTLESFYEEMSEDDILYRDCVEVWAGDAKPAALRLIKYVEGIEDKQTAALIGREVEYLNAMIDRINCFTQLEYIDELLEYKVHNYSTLVKDCLKRFSPFFMEKRLGLLWKGLDINVMTDRRWFIFALTQVIFNAVEFTPAGGKIAISAKKQENSIDLTIEDSGKGINPDELPFIFMAGYMGDDVPNESGTRTGMGLFIAQSVMRKMGGDMLAESTPGKGTRITLRMPIIEPTA